MQGIHAACVKYGRRADGSTSYIEGANIAGFVESGRCHAGPRRDLNHPAEHKKSATAMR